MGRFKIIYDLKSCIGAGECEALSKEFWKVSGKGKAELKGSVLNPATGKYELDLDEAQLKNQSRIADSCPGGCIKIQKLA